MVNNKKIKNKKSYKFLSISEAFFNIQIVLVWLYLFINISKIGEVGGGLEYLGGLILIGFFCLFFKCIYFKVKISRHFIVLIILALWLCIRFLIDYQDAIALREFTIGTTGGILFFYLVGMIVNQAIFTGRIRLNLYFIPLSIILFGLNLWVFDNLSSRVREDIFLIDDPDGSYQRPGNFISIAFVIYSAIYSLSIIVDYYVKSSKVFGLISFGFYVSIAVTMLILAQLIGSNSATAIIAVFTLTSASLYYAFMSNFPKKIINKNIYYYLIKSLFYVCFIAIILFAPFLMHLDVDLTQIRIFGFGNYDSTSISSRVDILKRWGIEQISYAPIFGNVKVAYYVTGDYGTTLHNFLPSALASLGLVGFSCIVYIFYCIIKKIKKSINNNSRINPIKSNVENILKVNIIITILILFVFANLTVDYSWCVIWFSFGLYSQSLIFEKVNRTKSKN